MEEQKLPQCVGLIMDGNRRWAKEQGRGSLEGHNRGYAKMKDVALWCEEAGVKHLVVYAFSTENWGRSEEEVAGLMNIFRTMIMIDNAWFTREGLCVKFIGQKARFPEDIQKEMVRIEKETTGREFQLSLCLSYGGRPEILKAVNQIINEKIQVPITEEIFQKYLWTTDIPDPDIIIRTGGEKRLSNFLTWQSVYSELFFTDTFFPALTKEEFMTILKDFSARERRRGK